MSPHPLYTVSPSLYSLLCSFLFPCPRHAVLGSGFLGVCHIFVLFFFQKKNLTPQHLSSNIFTEGRNSHAVLWNGINADENGKAGFGTLTHTHNYNWLGPFFFCFALIPKRVRGRTGKALRKATGVFLFFLFSLLCLYLIFKR